MPVLKAELPVGMLDRFSAEAASAVHAANVVSLLLQSPAAAPEVTSPEVTSPEVTLRGGGSDVTGSNVARRRK